MEIWGTYKVDQVASVRVQAGDLSPNDRAQDAYPERHPSRRAFVDEQANLTSLAVCRLSPTSRRAR